MSAATAAKPKTRTRKAVAAAAAAPAKTAPKVRKPNRYMRVECSHCHQENTIDRSFAAVCPECDALPGAPCVDKRSKARGTIVALAQVHTARVTLVNAALNAQPTS